MVLPTLRHSSYSLILSFALGRNLIGPKEYELSYYKLAAEHPVDRHGTLMFIVLARIRAFATEATVIL